jgi:hypothetical protein
MRIVATPSRMKSHFQPAMPPTLSMPPRMPAAMRPARALLMIEPEYRIAVRVESSVFVYHLERMSRALRGCQRVSG